MKHLLLSFLVLFAYSVFGQDTIVMQDGTITTDNAIFYDSGGSDGNYVNNEYETLTIYPATTGYTLQVEFVSFSLESGFDDLYIYDGTSTSATLIGSYSGTSGPQIITAANNDGALTFLFDSDGSITRSGWEAIITTIPYISAAFSAEQVIGEAPFTVNFSDESYGDIISWEWDFDGDGLIDATDQYPSFTYTETGIYPVTLTVSNGVSSTSVTYNDYITSTTNLVSFSGRVIDAYTEIPVANAIVNIDGYETISDVNGIYSITTTGTNLITASAEGYNYFSYDEYSSDIGGSYYEIRIMPTSIITDAGYLIDRSGPDTVYVDHENYTVTIYPETSGNYIRLTVTDLVMESCCDYFRVYDGTTTNSTQLGSYNGTTIPAPFTATNADGALTIYFTSDLSVTGDGWEAEISSVSSVVDFYADITSGVAPLTTNFFDQSVGNIVSWAWDFNNDGITDATDQNPIITFDTPGLYTVSLTVSDGVNEYTTTYTDYIVVDASNECPVLDIAFLDITRESGFSQEVIDLSLYFYDPDGDALSYYVEGDFYSTAFVEGNYLYISESTIGTDELYVEAYDAVSGCIASDYFIFEVTSGPNQCPVLDAYIPDFERPVGFGQEMIDLSQYFYDPDGDILSYTVYNASNTGAVIEGSMLYLNEYLTGTDELYVEAYDAVSGCIASDYFIFEVTSGPNQCPVLDAYIPDFDRSVGFVQEVIDLTQYFYDPEGDLLSYYVSGDSYSYAYIEGSDLYITEGSAGTDELYVEAYDAMSDCYASDFLYFTVSGISNEAPYLNNPLGDVVLTAGFGSTQIDLSNVFYDPDGDAITIDVSVSNSNISAYISENILYINEGSNGSTTVTLEAWDGINENSAYDYFVVTVGEPIIGGFCDYAIEASLGMNFADNIDGDQWFYFTPPVSDYYTIFTCGLTSVDTYVRVYDNCNSTYLHSTDDDCNLQTEISFYADAGVTYYIEWRNTYANNQNYDWTIEQGALGRPYVDNYFSTITVDAGYISVDPLDLDYYFSHTQSSTLSYEYQSAYNINAYSIEGNYFYINEVDGNTGTDYVTITATDENGISVSYELVINVLGDPLNNNAPIVSQPLSPISLEFGFDVYSVDISDVFTDPDNDMLVYSASTTSGNVYSYIEGTLLYIEEGGNEDATNVVTITATDLYGASVTSTVTITINVIDNDPPIAVNVPDDVVVELGFDPYVINLNHVFDDPEGDDLEFGLYFDNGSLISDYILVDGELTLIGQNGATGLDYLTLWAYDGFNNEVEIEISFSVIEAGNTIPTTTESIVRLDIVASDTIINLLDYFVDADGDVLSFSIIEGSEVASVNSSNQLVVDLVTTGEYGYIEVLANDGRGGVVELTFIFASNEPGNNQPVIEGSIGNVELDSENSTFSISLVGLFTDADNDVLEYHAIVENENIANVEIRNDTLFIEGVAYGETNVSIVAIDNRGGAVYYDFVVSYEEHTTPQTSTIEVKEDAIKVYPTVASSIITVEATIGDLVQITSLTGNVILQTVAMDDKFEINISSLAEGSYLVTVDNTTVSIIKE